MRSLGYVHAAGLVQNSGTVLSWAFRFTTQHFGLESDLSTLKPDSLLQSFLSLHSSPQSIMERARDWTGEWSFRRHMRYEYQGNRLSLIQSKMPKPSIISIYQVIIHLRQSTDLLMLHGVMHLHNHVQRDRNIVSPSEDCVLTALSGLWLPLVRNFLFCFSKMNRTQLYLNEVMINIFL